MSIMQNASAQTCGSPGWIVLGGASQEIFKTRKTLRTINEVEYGLSFFACHTWSDVHHDQMSHQCGIFVGQH